jgi:hypothetical protein
MFPSASLFFPFFHFPPLFMLVVLFLYFLPAFLARDKPSFTGILVLNLLAGWTFIGWIVALIWAVSAERQPPAHRPPRPALSFSAAVVGSAAPRANIFAVPVAPPSQPRNADAATLGEPHRWRP